MNYKLVEIKANNNYFHAIILQINLFDYKKKLFLRFFLMLIILILLFLLYIFIIIMCNTC